MRKNDIIRICGGVVSRSEFNKDPMAYMMCFVMDDDYFKEYEAIEDPKKAVKFREKAWEKRKLFSPI